MRLSIALAALTALSVLPLAGHAATNPCDLLSESAVRLLTGVDDGRFTARATAPATCLYTFPGTHAATQDSFGQPIPPPTLTLERYRLPTDAAAHALLKKRGDTDLMSSTTVLTDDPIGDEIGDLERPEGDPDEHEFLVLGGATARHGGNVAILGFSNGVNETEASILQTQQTALTLAGAHLVAPVRTDLCAQFPVRTLQTLIALGPSQANQTRNNLIGNVNTCSWQVVSDAQSDNAASRHRSAPATIKVTVQQFLTAALALAQFKQDAGPHQDVTPIPNDPNPSDEAYSKRGDSPEAEAVHGVFVAHWTLTDAEPAATAVPSYAGRLESLALTAAGANLPADPAIPPPSMAPPRAANYATQHALSKLWGTISFPTIMLLVLAFFVVGWVRRQRLKTTGLPGTALITGMSDTGITINNNPRVRLQMTVTPQSGAPYTVNYRETISRLSAGNMIGQTVNVRIDPNNPSRIVIV